MSREFLYGVITSYSIHYTKLYETLDEGVGYYKEYAAFVGFDVPSSIVKKNRYGDVELKYLLCSREGYTVTKEQRSTTTGEANGANINTLHADVCQTGLGVWLGVP